MKAKILYCYYTGESGGKLVRCYLEKDYGQAKKDHELMVEFASDCRTWKLEEVEIFGFNSPDLLPSS
jgi:hypothetical protein